MGMTVRVERTFELDTPPEDVWEFIADPEKRARPISVIDDFEITGENTATWHVRLPIPLINRTVTIETEDTERDSPNYVRFVGRSSVLRVVGEHEIEETDHGSRLTNNFTVDGKIPGVERFFKHNLDSELDNIEDALRAEFEQSD
jgi:carbon monoxide dehydrogenase subunit G